MSEQETHESISFPQLQKVLQEAYTNFALTSEAVPVSAEEFEACLNTLHKLWQPPLASPKDLTLSTLSSLAQDVIKDKVEWIDERFAAALENCENEAEIGLTLLQSRRMLREQVWPLCTMSPCHKRLLTFLINAIDRARPKAITTSQLNLLQEHIALLAKTEVTVEVLEEAEDALLTIA
jgi:hypothetical protein